MTTKERIIRAVEELPANATIEDAMERLLFLAKIERGLKQADAVKIGVTSSNVKIGFKKELGGASGGWSRIL